MKKLLPLVFLLIGLGAGVGAGVMLGGGKPPKDAETTEAKDGDAEKSEDKKEKKAEKQKDADGEDVGNEYLKLSKQFVVPLVSKDGVKGLVTVSLSLETSPGNTEVFYAKEPKLRDTFLQVLFDHANMGGFDGAFTRPENLDVLRGSLFDVAKQAMGDQVHAVLISDIARQDTR